MSVMNVFRKKQDPIAQREKALRERIQALETQIRELKHRIAEEQAQPKLRSTALAHSSRTITVSAQAEPRFEEVNHGKVQHFEDVFDDRAHYNELGLRKYDPFAG
ncbi:MAG: hypothetical protein N3G20_02365, partial [Verrucomicrobiae bacterium]|nr:hypothetical protein [Verrucomicrobiae bacterium]